MNDKPEPIQKSSNDKKNLNLEEAETDQKSNIDLNGFLSECRKREYKWSKFSELAHNIDSEDQLKRFSGLIGIQKLLNDAFSQGNVQKVIDAGLIARLVEFMKKDSEPQLQEEACWALVGITAGTSDQVQEVIDEGAVPILIGFLDSSHTPLVLSAIMALGNIPSYPPHPPYRDLLLDLEVLPPLVDVLKEALVKKDSSLILEGTRTLSLLCRGSPSPIYEEIADATPVFCTVIQEVTDMNSLTDALWALSVLSRKEEGVERILEFDVVPHLVRCLEYAEYFVVIPTVRTLGNISAGSDEQADALLKVSVTRSYVKKLFRLLKERSDSKAIRREICWSLSNITYRSPDNIDLVIGNPEYTEQLVKTSLYDVLGVQLEAASTLKNATLEATKNQMISMSRSGVFDCMRKLIQQDQQDSEVLDVGLKGIQNFLAFGASKSRKEAANNQFLISMKQKSVIHKIKKLRKSQDFEVCEAALEMWKKHLQGHILKKNLRLKRAIICFRSERHSLFGLFVNKKKRLDL